MASAAATQAVPDESAEMLDMSGSELTDATSLERCAQLVSLSLRSSANFTSCSGLERLQRLWILDLRGCALSAVEPVVALGALGELRLSQNRISLHAALGLRHMAIGRLGLQGNPLLPEELRSVLGVGPDTDDARLLRSYLADSFPHVIALDDSFVTSAHRPLPQPRLSLSLASRAS
jgi:hypothetical protein